MSDVPQSWRMVLETLVAGMSPWMTPAAVADRLGLDVEETTDMLASLDAAGLVSVREPDGPDGPVVAVSPRGSDLVRPAPSERNGSSSARDRRGSADGWVSSYDYDDDRSSRNRTVATAVGSVVS